MDVNAIKTELNNLCRVKDHIRCLRQTLAGHKDVLHRENDEATRLLDEKLNAEIEEASRSENIWIERILKLHDRTHQTVLIEHYINGRTFLQVSLIMHYSESQIMRINKSALELLAIIINKEG